MRSRGRAVSIDVSVVIPTFRRPALLREAITKPLSQFDLYTYKIVWIVEPPASNAINRIGPAAANYGEEDVALADPLSDLPRKIKTWQEAVDIIKDAFAGEHFFELVIETTRGGLRIFASVINEDDCFHWPCTHQVR
jgi:hypothetical protein